MVHIIYISIIILIIIPLTAVAVKKAIYKELQPVADKMEHVAFAFNLIVNELEKHEQSNRINGVAGDSTE